MNNITKSLPKWVFLFLFILPFTTKGQCIEGNCTNGEGILIMEGGKRYTGSFVGGKMQGEGVFYFADGSRYIGTFYAGNFHGQGLILYPDGNKREGTWRAGQLESATDAPIELNDKGLAQNACISGDCENGKGTYISIGGAVYVGEFYKGEIHGQGICYYPDGSKFQGNWVNRLPDGQGTKTWPNGKVHTGLWEKGDPISNDGSFLSETQIGQFPDSYFPAQHGCIHGNCETGEGTYAYIDGSRYEGQFYEGQPQGSGTFFYPNGDTYKGQFLHGLPHGQGIKTYNDGRQQGGEWIEGSFNSSLFNPNQAPPTGCIRGDCQAGFGTYIFKEGDRYTGAFQNGKPNGNGQVIYKNGDRYEGGMQAGAFAGFGTFYEKSGAVYKGEWQNGHFMGQSPNAAITSQNQGPKMNVWALIIGVSAYKHMPALRFPDDDAYRLFAFLKSPQGGALSDEQVQILIDEDATKANIQSSIQRLFSRAGPNDLVILYFSGHGQPGAFLPIDYDGINNLVKHSDIRQLLNDSPAGYKLCLADACHSGGLLTSRGRQLPDILNTYYENLQNTERGTALIMSSKSDETSLESSGLRQGVFSHFLLRGLKGEADFDSDGVVRIQEIYQYVEQNVRNYTRNAQSPVIYGDYDHQMPVGVVR